MKIKLNIRDCRDDYEKCIASYIEFMIDNLMDFVKELDHIEKIEEYNEEDMK